MDDKQIAAQLEHLEFEVKVGLKSAALPKVLAQVQDLHAKALAQYKESFLAKLFPEYVADQDSTLSAPETHRLENTYFDTEDDALYSQCSAGLRLRRYTKGDNLRIHKHYDDDKVEQTLKLKGKESGAAHSHLEYNVAVENTRTVPSFDLFTDVQWPENVDIKSLQDKLLPRYVTDFYRSAYTFFLPGVGTVEMAFDQGLIRAGSVERALGELEIEIKSCEDMAKLFAQKFDDVTLEDIKLYLTDALYTYVNLLDKQIEKDLDIVFLSLEPLSKLKRAVLLKENAYYLQQGPALEIFLADQSFKEDCLNAELTPLAGADAFSTLRKSIMSLYTKARLFFPGYEKDADRLLKAKIEELISRVEAASDFAQKDIVLVYLSSLIKQDISRAYYESASIAQRSFYLAKSALNGVSLEHTQQMCNFMKQAHA